MNASPERPNVTAIVVAYGESPTLGRAVHALLASEGVDLEVVVVDNGAAAQALAQLPDDARVRTTKSPQNLGFGAGCNLGVSIAQGETLVFVNPDAVVAPTAVAVLANALSDPEVGIASASVRLLGEPERMNSAGGAIHFLGLGWATGFGDLASLYAEPRDIAAASGAAMAIRSSVFAALGGFTEELFLYHEDAELSLRCWMAGLRVRFVPDAQVEHDYEFSRHGTKLYFLERNRLVLVATCYQRRTLFLVAPALVAYEIGMVAVAFRQRWGWDKLRGWRWLWEHRSWIRRQRERVQGQRRIGDRRLVPLLADRFDAPAMPTGAVVAVADRCFAAYWRIMRRFV